MAKVNDEFIVKCKGTRQIDVSPTCVNFYQKPDGTGTAINTGGYEIGIECSDYIIQDSTAIMKAYDNWCMSNLIKKVIFSDPCTIVIWNDGTKTIVRCTDEKFDKEKGLAMCIAKKSLGNKGKYYDVFKKWIKEDEK